MTLVFEDPESASLSGIAAFSHAIMMASKLPQKVYENYEGVVRVACIESWFTNMRLLCEFFGVAGNGGHADRDYKAKDFAPVSIDQDVEKDMRNLWTLSSKLVIHISKDRHELLKLENFDFSQEFMKNSALQILAISLNWAKNLRDFGSEIEPLVSSANELALKELRKL